MEDLWLIESQAARVCDGKTTLVADLPLSIPARGGLLVYGKNGSGKSALCAALAGELELRHADGSLVDFGSGARILVSASASKKLIDTELANNDSDFNEGGYWLGTSVRQYLCDDSFGAGFATLPAAALDLLERFALNEVLERGLRFLSSGELRKTMLIKALISNAKLLIFDEVMDGLDAASRKVLLAILARLEHYSKETVFVWASASLNKLPSDLTHVLQLSLEQNKKQHKFVTLKEFMKSPAAKEQGEGKRLLLDLGSRPAFSANEELVKITNLHVQWGETVVFDSFDWTLHAGEHTLIRGPNGSGKSTLLGIINGDCPQVYSNEVYIFGIRRGSGESVWDLRADMGIVSPQLHEQMLRLGSVSVADVVLSGFFDSIGVYCQVGASHLERMRAWLGFLGMIERERDSFTVLSYGQQRALLLVRAVIKLPKLLLLDEPCDGLDGPSRQDVLRLIEEIAARNLSTVVQVSHKEDECLGCIKRVIELGL